MSVANSRSYLRFMHALYKRTRLFSKSENENGKKRHSFVHNGVTSLDATQFVQEFFFFFFFFFDFLLKMYF